MERESCRPATVYNEPVIQLDILPTALAAAGVAAKPDWHLDGVNLLPHLHGQTASPPHESLYWRLGPQWAIRRGDWKLVQYDEAADHTDVRSVASEVKVTSPRLYDLAQDIGEHHDLSAKDPARFKELRHAWQSWDAQLAPPLWRTSTATTASRPAGRPNIVFILADDLGWGDVGWHGSEIKTPQLDKLAASGARLEQFYVQPVCSPTRGPAHRQVSLPPWSADRRCPALGTVRPSARGANAGPGTPDPGYETAICGKWHLGHVQTEYLPTHRGFDHQYGHYNGAIDYFTHQHDGGHDWHRDDRASHDKGYSTHLLADEATRLIAEHDTARPLFLYVAFNAVHAPHQVPDSYKAPYAKLPEPRRSYAGMLAAMDEAVGRIVHAVGKKGIASNTLFVFSSDNGGPDPGRVTSNGPLRASKATVYEGGVRVPAFASWAGHIKPGSVVNAPLHIVDWYPTLIKLAGGSVEQPLPIDGRDAWPTIAEGKPTPHDDLLLNSTPGGGAIRVGDWKLVINGKVVIRTHGRRREFATPQRWNGPETLELFNLAVDPFEKKNLADENPEKTSELHERYERWAHQAVPPKSVLKTAGFHSPRVWGEPD